MQKFKTLSNNFRDKNPDDNMNLGKLPLPLPSINKSYSHITNSWNASLLNYRQSCLINNSSKDLDYLSIIDVWVAYASALLQEIVNTPNTTNEITLLFKNDLAVAICNCGHYYQLLALDIMQRAYQIEEKTTLWATSGTYLKKGLGLAQFFKENYDSLISINSYYGILIELINQIKLTQQLGVLVLSLSKLRSNMYNGKKDGILDITSQDISALTSNSLLYSKLAIGCKNSIQQCSRSNSVTNQNALAYVDGLSYLLLSLNEYQKDELGNAIGLLNLSITKFRIIDASLFGEDSLLAKAKKGDKFKKMLKIPASNKIIQKIELKNSSNLAPFLNVTLDDFIIPLLTLLKYRYNKTNDKVSFKVVQTDTQILQALLPRGIAPDLQGTQWKFSAEKLHPVSDVDNSSQYNYF